MLVRHMPDDLFIVIANSLNGNIGGRNWSTFAGMKDYLSMIHSIFIIAMMS